ncbi:unnamed protein product (macronuclear) [Paramecium tetraurelia]|uniref:Thioredoxin domain-containing protein n=1 Tax=Paramecium tetraurelia TaxID=5888 RepID=A0BN07_PARTE|nr:uncharacterized protein GSPATT00030561001 [Paramecium tetraurelia]CAK59924.1 unnamed protein product [Paramecium tetraurelia]|eukprot:XP_001427322.1 hypothetical protein (macronuclear) [Paramecium tetraurelia strain d4-2]
MLKRIVNWFPRFSYQFGGVYKFVMEANDLQEIEKLSEERMIFLNCYASWSSECKQFNQTLLGHVRQYENVGTLINVDINKNEEIKQQLQIQSIPFVALVYKNSFIDIYQKNQNLENFIASIDRLSKEIKGEVIGDKIIVELNQHSFKENAQELIKLSASGLENERLKQYYDKFRLYQAKGHVLLGQFDMAEALFKQIERKQQDQEFNKLHQEITEFYKMIKDWHELPQTIKEELQELDKRPDDLNLRFQISENAISHRKYDLAIDLLLDLVRIDRNWEGRKAQKSLQQIFRELGSQNERVIRSRHELAQLLY